MNCKDCCQDCQRIGCDIEVNCTGYIAKPTNADCIRSMTDEELAEFLFRTFGKAAWCLDNNCPPEESCVPCWFEWLKQESENLNE